MIIKNGIAYAVNNEPMVRVKTVKPLENFNLLVGLSNGIKKVVSVEPLLQHNVYKQLKDVSFFNGAYVDYGTVVWNNGELDISPEFFV